VTRKRVANAAASARVPAGVGATCFQQVAQSGRPASVRDGQRVDAWSILKADRCARFALVVERTFRHWHTWRPNPRCTRPRYALDSRRFRWFKVFSLVEARPSPARRVNSTLGRQAIGVVGRGHCEERRHAGGTHRRFSAIAMTRQRVANAASGARVPAFVGAARGPQVAQSGRRASVRNGQRVDSWSILKGRRVRPLRACGRAGISSSAYVAAQPTLHPTALRAGLAAAQAVQSCFTR
jgi:hypothetical protein